MNAVKTQVPMSNFVASLKLVPDIKYIKKVNRGKTGLMSKVISQISKGATTSHEIAKALNVGIVKINSAIYAARIKKVPCIIVTKETHGSRSIKVIRLVGDNSVYVRTNDTHLHVRRKALLDLCVNEYVCIKEVAIKLDVSLSTIYKDIAALQLDNKVTIRCGSKKVKAVCNG